MMVYVLKLLIECNSVHPWHYPVVIAEFYRPEDLYQRLDEIALDPKIFNPDLLAGKCWYAYAEWDSHKEGEEPNEENK